jgi:hypothetical protein
MTQPYCPLQTRIGHLVEYSRSAKERAEDGPQCHTPTILNILTARLERRLERLCRAMGLDPTSYEGRTEFARRAHLRYKDSWLDPKPTIVVRVKAPSRPSP